MKEKVYLQCLPLLLLMMLINEGFTTDVLRRPGNEDNKFRYGDDSEEPFDGPIIAVRFLFKLLAIAQIGVLASAIEQNEKKLDCVSFYLIRRIFSG